MSFKKFALAVCFVVTATFAQSQDFSIGDSSFLLNGRPYVIRCGELHFARIPKAYWPQRLRMAKAMGLNTVCAYLFWNFIEKQPGQMDWSGQADAAEFCRLAQKEGLYVILRPGPYSCAEWEFGGSPWWLLKDKTMSVRTRHPYYLQSARNYLLAVGKELAPLQINKGGNIIMVQVENEYGSFGSDRQYIGLIRDYIKEAGFTVPFFTCDGPSQLKNDVRPDIFAAVNFGGNPESSFKSLREIQKTGPLMCAEFYPGWFDSWGRKHHTGNSSRIITDLKWMLDHKASFSIYMAHGGTTFGTYSGANAPPYSPQTSSYDYDAPIDEAGNATEKFYLIRELMRQYLQPGETLPDVPAANSSQSIHNFQFLAVAPLWNNLTVPVNNTTPLLMEEMNQAYGAVLYTTKLPAGQKATVHFKEIHDYAIVYINKQQVGVLDRRKGTTSIAIPARSKPAVLEVLVEATGRVNYGGLMHDRKGIHGPVILEEENKKTELTNWMNYSLPMSEETFPLKFIPLTSQKRIAAAFYKAKFTVNELTDTYLDMRKWNKGLVWVNGICLGRYWNIGPTQTMYLPGCWLKKGSNEIVVFDLYGVQQPQLQSIQKPILDEVHEAMTQAHKKAGQKWLTDSSHAYHNGRFSNNKEWQQVSFSTTTARYVCLEAISEYNNQPYTTIAEIVLTDDKGKEIPRIGWKVIYADSEELLGEDGNAANVFDLQPTSIWHTEWQDRSPALPHCIVIDLGKEYTISSMKVLPRQDGINGRIKDYRLYFSSTVFPGL
ncbi:MAG: beta-galactosidase [Chitinophagaceae bacterium]